MTEPVADGIGWAAAVPAVAHVFADALEPVLDVAGDDGHHLARVLRVRPGETVTVADGGGRWRPYRVATADGAGVRLEAGGECRLEPVLSPRLAVAFALTKGDKPELTVQKLTELGVERIRPVLAQHSVVRLDSGRAAAAHRRWQRVAAQAACQCRRARLPEVSELAPLGALAGHPGLVVADRAAPPPGDLARPPGGEILVVVGPEGGLSEAETDLLEPWARIGVGPHVLRAETAALAVAAVLAAARMRSSTGG
jgi:16S rRNA (uracil1498-N3)-methyltransferase